MTQDEIKKIAENIVDGDILHIKGYELSPEVTVPIIEDAIEQILRNYFIVEKSKVKEKYKAIQFLNQVGCQDRLDLLESLFGADAFKETN